MLYIHLQVGYLQSANCRLYIPIEALIREAAEMLTDVDGAKLVIIAGSPGMGKSMLANHLACTSLLNSRPLKSSEAFGNGHESLAVSQPSPDCLQSTFLENSKF